jgi:hypothetical protein
MDDKSVTGHVYILVNSSFPDLVKIGRTTKDPVERARELRVTGVPTPFIVAYSVLVSDCCSLESLMHEELAEFRLSNDREFFKVDPKIAINLLVQKSQPLPINQDPEPEQKTYLYAFFIEPFDASEGKNVIHMAPHVLDDRAWKLFSGPLFGQERDDEWPAFACKRNSQGELLMGIYRIGLTKSNTDDLFFDFCAYAHSDAGLRMSGWPKLIRHQLAYGLDLSQVFDEHSDLVLSRSEQLLYCSSSSIQAILSHLSKISDMHLNEEKRKVLAATEQADISSIRGRL